MFLRTRRCLYDSYASSTKQLTDLVASFRTPQRNEATEKRMVADFVHSCLSKRGVRSVRPFGCRGKDQRSAFHESRRNVSMILREAKMNSLGLLAIYCLECVFEQDNLVAKEWPKSWLLDARAAASSVEEVRRIDILIRRAQSASPQTLPLDERATSLAVVPAGASASPSLPALRGSTADVLLSSSSRGQREVVPNDSFQRYFLKQKLMPTGAAVMELVRALNAAPLTVVRMHRSSPLGTVAAELLAKLRSNGLVVSPPMRAMASADSYVVPRHQHESGPSLRKSSLTSAMVRSLLEHKVCSIQSASSLLPALVLDAQPGERVLDFCAAPGSKTALMLDQIIAASQQIPPNDCRSIASSLLCANDASLERAAALSDRLGGTDVGVVILSSPDDATSSSCCSTHDADAVKFDKILVDAPCTGEGQLHRRPAEWRQWHPMRGVAFHKRQLSILRRAIAMSRIGGTIVYSTCTLNPIENEAVVAAVVSEGLVEPMEVRRGGPLDVPRSACALVPGLDSWHVPSPSGGFLPEDHIECADVPQSLFPTYSTVAQREGIAKCSRRVVPRLTNSTGNDRSSPPMEAFFIIALRRLSAVSGTESPAPSPALQLHQRSSWRNKATTSLRTGSGLAATGGLEVLSIVSSKQALLDGVVRFFSRFANLRSAASASIDSMRSTLSRAQQELGIRFLKARDGSLYIASEAAAAFITHSDGGFAASPTALLLACGARVLDSSGCLTEVGAHALVHRLGCTDGQVFRIGLREAHLLLSGTQTVVVPLTEGSHPQVDDPFGAAVASMTNRPTTAAQTMAQSWRMQFVREPERYQDGNAVALVDMREDETGAGSVGPPIRSWAFPVTLTRCIVRGVPSMQVRSNLSTAATRRATGLLGLMHRSRHSLASATLLSQRARNGLHEMVGKADPFVPKEFSRLAPLQHAAEVLANDASSSQSLEQLRLRAAKERDIVRL